MFNKLIVWSKLSLKQRYNLLIASIIAVLGYVIVWQDSEHRIYVKECRAAKVQLQDKIDEQKEERLLYFQQMSNDYMTFLNELNKIKNKENENNPD
ncbi:hypothetical protein [Terasakiella sp.]|uniref:hypothetical protein n=1 Tax=Terasakiella sp. TaxID=2034861 RepID=UPI003AA7B4CD